MQRYNRHRRSRSTNTEPTMTMTAATTDRLIPDSSKHSKFWHNAHLYFDRVYQSMNLDPMWRAFSPRPSAC